jgi:hypothetical protein
MPAVAKHIMHAYLKALSTIPVPVQLQGHCMKWLRYYLEFCGKYQNVAASCESFKLCDSVRSACSSALKLSAPYGLSRRLSCLELS